jgi:exodeoxyribonuclease VII small subunit
MRSCPAQSVFDVRLKSSTAREKHMARTSATAPKEPASYEQAVAELDQLVQRMEAGQLPLDQLLDSYRRGADLLHWCRQRLQAVEEQVKVLEDGELKAWSTP